MIFLVIIIIGNKRPFDSILAIDFFSRDSSSSFHYSSVCICGESLVRFNTDTYGREAEADTDTNRQSNRDRQRDRQIETCRPMDRERHTER